MASIDAKPHQLSDAFLLFENDGADQICILLVEHFGALQYPLDLNRIRYTHVDSSTKTLAIKFDIEVTRGWNGTKSST
jgi:hypothetical protein